MKVSLLLVTYNHEKYIRKAIESLLIQKDLPDYEILLFDDCSTDNTVKIAEEMFRQLPMSSIHVNETNRGITRNYEQAFSMCRGEYIFILEGDDYWIDPYKVNKQVTFMDNHPYCSMCAHAFIVQQMDTDVFSFPEYKAAPAYLLFDGKDLILDEGIVSNFSTCCYRNAMLKKISSATYETISYDWMVNISISQYGFLARINEAMSVYRHSEKGSWSSIPAVTQLEGMIGIIPEYDRILTYRYSKYFRMKTTMLEEKLRELTAKTPANSHQSIILKLKQLKRWLVRQNISRK